MSRRVYYLAGTFAIAFAAAAIVWNVVGTRDESRRDPKSTAAPGSLVDAVKLAENNDPVAEYKLAHMYATADTLPGNKKQALAWLERAAAHGHIEAQYEFGNALREGNGVVQDYERAAKWLQLSAERGYADAQYALGQMYRMGMGVPVDNARAYMWFNLAAAQELPGAAVQRDVVLRSLSPAQVLEAQADARRLNAAGTESSATAR